MKKIYLNYQNSGVKTLRGASGFIIILGLISSILVFISCFAEVPSSRYTTEKVFIWQNLSNVFLIIVATITCAGICTALAAIAENSLIAKAQRKELLQKEGIELEIYDAIHQKSEEA